MAQIFDEAMERHNLSNAEDRILTTVKKHNLAVFFLDDDLYVFSLDRNVKIFKGKLSAGFDYFIQLIQEGQSHTRLILSPTEKKLIKEAMNLYIPRYAGFTFRPSDNRVEEINGYRYYNMFQPPFYADKPLLEPYSFPTIEKFLNVFFREDEKDWFLHRLAHTIQEPDIRLPTIMLLTGMQGSGKDTLKTIIERTLGEQNLAYLDQNGLEGQFNSFIGKAQVVFANELQAGSKNQDKILSILKHYATNKKIMINEKHIPHYTANNYAFWILATNDHKFRPPDENDRRYSVFFNGNKLINMLDTTEFNTLMDLIQNPSHENETYSEFHHFYWYLKNLTIKKDVITFPLNTEYKEQMVNSKLGNNIEWSVMMNAIKDMIDEDKGSRHLLNYTKQIIIDKGSYYIKPKNIIEKIINKKQDLHKLDEGKYRITYDGIKYFLIGNHWFIDYTKKIKLVNGIAMRVFQINEKRIIDLIDGKDTETTDVNGGNE